MNNFVHNGYFSSEKLDKEVSNILDQELNRQKTHIELIASENYVSKAVLNALGSIFNNKSVEGYPFKRYYSGVEFSDNLENLAIDRAKKLFRCQYANVQPHSGSQANHAAYMALLQPGDKILSMELSSGGHLSHGAKPNFSSRVYKFYNYGLNSTTDLIDYENLEKIAKEKLPKLIIAGGSSYSRIIDFERIGKVAKEIGAFFLFNCVLIALVTPSKYPSSVGVTVPFFATLPSSLLISTLSAVKLLVFIFVVAPVRVACFVFICVWISLEIPFKYPNVVSETLVEPTLNVPFTVNVPVDSKFANFKLP